jgi:hypothetical protein
VTRRRAVLSGAAIVFLVVFTGLYRFNTLGGALGGFDDDHFVHFAYAKQVQAGEQPVRDFDGLGLQGARPSLTYELSAAAQSALGNNLRSEALLTVAALALAAGLTFQAASAVAPAGWALAATLLTVLLAPKLYSYPKVLLLAVAMVCIVWFARRRSPVAVAALACLAAVAFLFRHDYAAYVGVGAVVVLAIGSGRARRAGVHLASYGAVIILLLAPSLWNLHREAGLVQYFHDGVEQSRNEAGRTELQQPEFVSVTDEGQPVTLRSALTVEQNAVAWLYYLHLVLPLAVLLLAVLRRDGERWNRVALIAISVAALGINPLLLRGNVGARLGDVGPVTAVLIAALMYGLTSGRAGTRAAIRVGGAAAAAFILAATTVAVWTVGSVRSELDTSGWSEPGTKVAQQAARRWDELAQLPAAFWSEPQPSASLRAARYLNQCTAPGDRVVVMSYQPELLALSDRRFGAGRAAVLPDLLSDDAHEKVMLERWREQRVPLVITAPSDDYESDYPTQFALLHAYLQEAYAPAGSLEIDGGDVLQVLSDRRLTPVRTFGDEKLPCFR